MPREPSVADLMRTCLVVGQLHDTVHGATLKMRSAAIRHLPIVDGEYRLVGIVSERDVAPVVEAEEQQVRDGRPLDDEDATRVGEIMTRAVFAVSPFTPAADAAGVLIEQRIGALPVVDEVGRLLGIVTVTDFLRYAQD